MKEESRIEKGFLLVVWVSPEETTMVVVGVAFFWPFEQRRESELKNKLGKVSEGKWEYG